MLKFTQQQLEKIKKIIETYYGRTKFPKKDNWKHLSDNELWLKVFTQVMIVGNSNSYNEFSINETVRRSISFETLSKIVNDEDLKKKLNQALLAFGSRYTCIEYTKCKKTDALFHNFKVLRSTDCGPKGFFARIVELNEDKPRIQYLAKSFKYIKNKGARDLLMEMGILENSIAFDTRIKNILNKLGFVLPQGFEKNPDFYAEIERDILKGVCGPLRITGMEFDRILYQNYQDIMQGTQ